MLRFRHLPLLPLGLLLFGCGDSSSSSTIDEHVTLVAVSPSEFLGDVGCSDSPGDMRTYVATLIDVTDVDAEAAGATSLPDFPLPAAPPTPCTQDIAFGRVREGRSYIAQIDGYRRSDLEPLTPGSSTLIAPEIEQLVPPTWTIVCGDVEASGTEAPTVARSKTTTYVRGCSAPAPLVASAPLPVELQLDTVLGDLKCGSGATDIAHLHVLVDGAEAGAPIECMLPRTTLPLPLPVPQTFRLEATSPAEESVAPWATSCELLEGSAGRWIAECSPFSSAGSVELSMPTLLESGGVACGEATTVTIEDSGEALLDSAPLDCDSTLELANLLAGLHDLTIYAFDETGAQLVMVSCPVVVAAAETLAADCSATGDET